LSLRADDQSVPRIAGIGGAAHAHDMDNLADDPADREKKRPSELSALLAFVLVELTAVIGGVAVFPGLVMGVDSPFVAVSEGE
jgi:hypothetical protein